MSAMTGEAEAARVHPGASVIGGTVVLDGRLVVEAAAVGADTHFAGMVRLVEEAQAQKADAQRLADRIAGVFVPAVFVIAALTAAVGCSPARGLTRRSLRRWQCWSSPVRARSAWRRRPR